MKDELRERFQRFFVSGSVPDAADPRWHRMWEGGVKSWIESETRRVLDLLQRHRETLPDLSILIEFSPGGSSNGPKERVASYYRVASDDKDACDDVSFAIINGGLGPAYDLSEINSLKIDTGKYHHSCAVLSRQDFVDSPFDLEQNPGIFKSYHQPVLLIPNLSNTYWGLDDALNKSEESVLVTLDVRPEDPSNILQRLSLFEAELKKVNQTPSTNWALEGGEEASWEDDPGSGFRSPRRDFPQVERDPVADETCQVVRRYREKIRHGLFRFNFRVWAESRGMTGHLASILGQCAFEVGSFQTEFVAENDPSFLSFRSAIQESRIVCLEQSDASSSGDSTLLTDPRKFSQLASFEDLVGGFRLPIGGYHGLKCFRQNTDPVAFEPKEVIFLGFGLE